MVFVERTGQQRHGADGQLAQFAVGGQGSNRGCALRHFRDFDFGETGVFNSCKSSQEEGFAMICTWFKRRLNASCGPLNRVLSLGKIPK